MARCKLACSLVFLLPAITASKRARSPGVNNSVLVSQDDAGNVQPAPRASSPRGSFASRFRDLVSRGIDTFAFNNSSAGDGSRRASAACLGFPRSVLEGFASMASAEDAGGVLETAASPEEMPTVTPEEEVEGAETREESKMPCYPPLPRKEFALRALFTDFLESDFSTDVAMRGSIATPANAGARCALTGASLPAPTGNIIYPGAFVRSVAKHDGQPRRWPGPEWGEHLAFNPYIVSAERSKPGEELGTVLSVNGEEALVSWAWKDGGHGGIHGHRKITERVADLRLDREVGNRELGAALGNVRNEILSFLSEKDKCDLRLFGRAFESFFSPNRVYFDAQFFRSELDVEYWQRGKNEYLHPQKPLVAPTISHTVRTTGEADREYAVRCFMKNFELTRPLPIELDCERPLGLRQPLGSYGGNSRGGRGGSASGLAQSMTQKRDQQYQRYYSRHDGKFRWSERGYLDFSWKVLADHADATGAHLSGRNTARAPENVLLHGEGGEELLAERLEGMSKKVSAVAEGTPIWRSEAFWNAHGENSSDGSKTTRVESTHNGGYEDRVLFDLGLPLAMQFESDGKVQHGRDAIKRQLLKDVEIPADLVAEGLQMQRREGLRMREATRAQKAAYEELHDSGSEAERSAPGSGGACGNANVGGDAGQKGDGDEEKKAEKSQKHFPKLYYALPDFHTFSPEQREAKNTLLLSRDFSTVVAAENRAIAAELVGGKGVFVDADDYVSLPRCAEVFEKEWRDNYSNDPHPAWHFRTERGRTQKPRSATARAEVEALGEFREFELGVGGQENLLPGEDLKTLADWLRVRSGALFHEFNIRCARCGITDVPGWCKEAGSALELFSQEESARTLLRRKLKALEGEIVNRLENPALMRAQGHFTRSRFVDLGRADARAIRNSMLLAEERSKIFPAPDPVPLGPTTLKFSMRMLREYLNLNVPQCAPRGYANSGAQRIWKALWDLMTSRGSSWDWNLNYDKHLPRFDAIPNGHLEDAEGGKLMDLRRLRSKRVAEEEKSREGEKERGESQERAGGEKESEEEKEEAKFDDDDPRVLRSYGSEPQLLPFNSPQLAQRTVLWRGGEDGEEEFEHAFVVAMTDVSASHISPPRAEGERWGMTNGFVHHARDAMDAKNAVIVGNKDGVVVDIFPLGLDFSLQRLDEAQVAWVKERLRTWRNGLFARE